MGQFKPMVKMETTEPSVILKLKKGGHVAMNSKSEHGHTNMRDNCADDEAAESGSAPKKPSMAERRKAMNPNFMKKGGKASDMSQDKAMIKKAFKQHDAQEHKGDKGTMLKLKKGGMYAAGGKIDAVMDKTTIKGNAGKFLNTMVMDGDKNDSAKGTGKVKNGNAGGYAAGGTIEGNAGKFLNTKVMDGDKNDSAKGSGGVKMGNGGGYKRGGKAMMHKAAGGAIEGNEMKFAINNVDSTPAGKSNTTTGGVKNGNGGGYKKGGAAKKHFATGGAVDTGRAVAMPKKPVSQPIRNTMQSGTFAKGGAVEKEEKPNLRLLKTHAGPKGHTAKVYKDKDWGEHRVKFFSPEGKHMSDSDYHTDDMADANDTAKGQLGRFKKGGVAHKAMGGKMEDLSNGAYDRSVGPDEDDMEMARAIRSVPSRIVNAAKRMMGKLPDTGAEAGRGFVNPPMARKHGGRAK
jgi:hypothetical protein